MNPHLDSIIQRLRKVKGRGDSFVACCPAHEDRSPSLTVRETQDGRILMHCFAGCSIGDITGALGVDMSDLFPPKADPIQPIKPERRRFFAADLLKVIEFEATIVALCAHDMSAGRTLADVDRDRLMLAKQRITSALEAGGL